MILCVIAYTRARDHTFIKINVKYFLFNFSNSLLYLLRKQMLFIRAISTENNAG